MAELKVRDAQPDELPAYAGVETWGCVLEENGEPVGLLCLSRALGQVFGHDTTCHASDPRGAAMLWLAGRRKAREWGATSVNVHLTENDPMKTFWLGRGFTPEFTVYRGAI